MRPQRRSRSAVMLMAWLLVIFLVLFPKGGVKFGYIPLTWGYLLLGLFTPFALVVRLLVMPLRVPRRLVAALALCLPMQAVLLFTLLLYGQSSLGYTVSTCAALVFLPIAFLVAFAPFLTFVDGVRFSRYLRLSILFAALWGIFLFVWHPFTGKFVEVPYLTVNAGDFGELETTKHISRGFFLKLISTYNNGNLYGVCMLLMMPLYDLLEPVRWRRYVLKAALLLTLSRTVWAGLIFSEVLSVLVIFARQLNTFPRLKPGRATQRLGALTAVIGFVFLMLLFNSSGLAFLFDPNLGGRTAQISSWSAITFLPSRAVDGLQESMFYSALQRFGVLGFLTFTMMFTSPLWLLLVDRSALQSPSRRAALKGLVIYMVIANVDGSFNFLPTMAFFWFVYMIYLFGWPSGAWSVRPHSAAPQVARLPGPEDLHPLLPV